MSSVSIEIEILKKKNQREMLEIVDLDKDVNWGKLKKMSLFGNSKGIAIWDKQTVASYK